MFPLSDNNPTRTRPYVTYALIAVNVAAFVHQISLNESGLTQFLYQYAVVPQEFSRSLSGEPMGQGVPEWVTLFTAQFLHGGFLHLFGNMLFLWIFGNNIEDQLGHSKYLFFYLSCGVLASLTQWAFTMNSTIPSLGASGAIAGVMGAYVLRFPQAQINTLVFFGFFVTMIRIPAFFYLGLWFVQQAISSVWSLGLDPNTGGVAYWAHAGGFVFGAALGSMLGLFSSRQD